MPGERRAMDGAAGAASVRGVRAMEGIAITSYSECRVGEPETAWLPVAGVPGERRAMDGAAGAASVR